MRNARSGMSVSSTRALFPAFGLRSAFDVLPVGSIVRLDVFELTLCVALGVQLFAGRAAMGGALGWHGHSPFRYACPNVASNVPQPRPATSNNAEAPHASAHGRAHGAN